MLDSIEILNREARDELTKKMPFKNRCQFKAKFEMLFRYLSRRLVRIYIVYSLGKETVKYLNLGIIKI